ncbi:DNA polymerase Y family protein [Wenjunlia tyrosinilytica]|nr:hypothetical protein [Wenjunlia tyrosinilytica]
MTILHVHLHTTPEEYPKLLDLLGGITPVVEALPPDAALLDVRGAVRYFGRGPRELADLIRVRALALHGVTCTIGVASNRLLATMAAQSGPSDAVRAVDDTPEAVTAFLRPKSPGALPGVGPATVKALVRHGLHTIGDVADTPLTTLQRLFGGAGGRRLHDHARGIDPRPVTPNAPAKSMTAERDFPLDTIDGDTVRRELLAMSVELGARLRATSQVAHTVVLTVRYADRSTTTRSRTPRDPTNSTAALTTCVYGIHESLGLQRARLRGLVMRAEGLTAAESTPRQLSLDPEDERIRRLEAAADRAAARFAAGAVTPAALLRRPPKNAA